MAFAHDLRQKIANGCVKYPGTGRHPARSGVFVAVAFGPHSPCRCRFGRGAAEEFTLTYVPR
jgi:hypothetical protein